MPATLKPSLVQAHAVTRGRHHFFGYYDKSPWDYSQRWMLGMESSFMDRPPTERDQLTIGLIDTENNGDWRPLAETRAWNWQQGCMLQWLNEGRGDEIIFNDCCDGRFVARVLNVKTGKERLLPRAVYGVNRSGTKAVSLNFSRLHHQRPGYGYAGPDDPWHDVPEPADDGLYAIDLASGESTLILSVAAAADFRRNPDSVGKMHRFNHAQFSRDGKRFAFLHRWKTPEEQVGHTRLMTLDIDGKELNCLSDHGLVSHYDWRDGKTILAWARRPHLGDHYFAFEDRSERLRPVGENVLVVDGHCSFSPDGEWILTDTYPDETQHRTLLLYHYASGERIDIGRFHAPKVKWETRCDLHPRWSVDGKSVCIDSAHEGSRQMYVLDVSEVVANS